MFAEEKEIGIGRSHGSSPYNLKIVDCYWKSIFFENVENYSSQS